MPANHNASQIVDERTPIIAGGQSASYHATEATGNHQTTGAEPNASEGAPQLNQRRKSKAASTGRRSVSQDDTSTPDKQSWLSRIVDKYGAVEIENKGSTARDHLALARAKVAAESSERLHAEYKYWNTYFALYRRLDRVFANLLTDLYTITSSNIAKLTSCVERTFLAWLRTSLSFASIGIAITQLFRLNSTIADSNGDQPAPNQPHNIRLRQIGRPLGATFLGIAILVLLLGWRRYFEGQFYIIKGKFPASRGSIFIVTFVAAALIVSTFVIVLAVDPTLFQKT